MIKIRLLGVPEVSVNEERLEDLYCAPTLLQLFCFLLTYRQRTHLRSDLASLLWPDREAAQTSQRLSNILWRLGKVLGEASTLLLIDRSCVRINLPDDCWLDVEEFELLTARFPSNVQCGNLESLEKAASLYRSPYIYGIEAEWAREERQHWQERYLQVLERLIELYRQAGRCTQALAYAKRLLEIDPYHEAGHTHLIELYMALHQREEAFAHVQHYLSALRNELQCAASLSMRALIRRYQLEPVGDEAYRSNSDYFTLSQHKSLSPVYLRREIEICCKSDELYDLMTDRGSQQENLRHLHTLAIQLNDPTVLVDCLARQVWLATRQGEYQEAILTAQSALQLCDRSNDWGQRALLHRLLGVASEEMGNFSAAHHHYHSALQLDENGQAPALIATDLNNLAAVYITWGDSQVALDTLVRAEKMIAKTPAITVQTKVLGNRGFAFLQVREIDQAKVAFQRAALLAKTSGEQDAEWWIGGGMIRLHILQKEYPQALQLANQQLQVLQAGGDACALSTITELLAHLYLETDEPKQALYWAQQTLHHAQQKQQWRYQLRGWMRLAQAQQRLAQPEAAIQSAIKAVDLYTSKAQRLTEESELRTILNHCCERIGSLL